MSENDPGHVNNLDKNQIELLKTYWISLISNINEDKSKIIDSPLGDELFFLFGKDNPDVILLRWLRANKWNISSSIYLMIDNLKWRHQWEIQKLIQNGENDLIIEECSSSKIYHMGKDKSGYPITYVHANQHIKGQFPFQYSEKFIIFNMEIGRYLVQSPFEQGTVVLDMGNVTFQNLDYQHIKFMINAMQNYYPECLSIALIVNAPWTFNIVWNIIRPWLDPIVESKIHFIKNSKELIEYIDPNFIPKRLEGNHMDFKYFPPTKEDQIRLSVIRKDKQGMIKAQIKYKEAKEYYLDITLKWANTTQKNDEQINLDRINATNSLTDSFQQLLPYISTETHYHRTGQIQENIFDLTFNRISNKDTEDTKF